MKAVLLLCGLVMPFLASCGVPGKYTRLDYSGASGGYRVVSESPGRAEIEAYTVEYHFLPEADLAATKARRHFMKSASRVAASKGANATSVVIEEGDITRNALAGTYKTVLTGTVSFGSGAPAYAASDRSMLGDLAESSARKSDAALRAADAMNEASREMNRDMRANSIRQSIDN
ncbi:MAG TPA: hypothetical protein VM511_07300, partial [Luteolibacter sp.]|nr:hypothetical protein [Luteolibacter sp.]